MDFHALPRRDLQSLCKRNKIPANLTNVAMADALTSLPSVEGLAEVQEALQFQSPNKMGLVSPAIPRTGRRTTARKAVGPAKGEKEEEEEGPKERQASPLPRARRVTARAPEILTMADGEDDVAQTPKAPATRRRAIKKDEGVTEAPTGQKTAATRRRAAPKEEGGMGVEKPAAGATTGRRTRQLAKKEVSLASAVGDDLMSGGMRRSTRGRGRSAAVKMASLAKEEDENQTKEAEHPVEQTADEVADKMEEDKGLGSKDQDCGKDQILDEKQEKPLEESFELVGEASEKDQDQGGDGLLSGFDDSPIRGLISCDQAPKQDPSVEEIENVQRSSEEEAIATDDGELNPEETEDSGVQSHDMLTCDQTDLSCQPLAAESKESGEGTGEKDTGDNNDLGFNPANCEIAAEATELDITVESQKKQPEEEDVTVESPEKQPEEEDSTAESTELEITVESPAVESPEKQPEEEDATAESTELDITVESPEKQPEEEDATAESTVLDITVESPAIEPPAKQPEEAAVTAEATELEITVGSPAVEPPAKQTEEEDAIGHAEVVVEVASDGTDGEVQQVSVEIDESGADLSGNNGLAGEIAVEAIGGKSPSLMQSEMADEVLGELMEGISDLKLSAGSEPPVAGIKERDDKENAALTETTADAAHVGVVGPRGKKYEDMSLRKLKAAFKYTLLSKGEGEEKRAALKAIDVNKDAADAATF